MWSGLVVPISGPLCDFHQPLRSLQRRRRHDVEVPRISRQVVPRPLDLQKDGGLQAIAEPFKLHFLFQAITWNVTLYLFDHAPDRTAYGVPISIVSEAEDCIAHDE